MAETQINPLEPPNPENECENPQNSPQSLNSPLTSQRDEASGRTELDINGAIMAARAKAVALAPQRQGSKPVSAPPAPSIMSLQVQDRISQLKARAAEANQKSIVSSPQPASLASSIRQSSEYDDGISKARGGLDVGLHPALMDLNQDLKSGNGLQFKQSKFATTVVNRLKRPLLASKQSKPTEQSDLSVPFFEEIKKNPYFDPSLGLQTISAGGRVSRRLIFNQKGKYMQQAAALRRMAALEAMKKRIAEKSRKAGMIDDIETEKVFLVAEPPEVEWWDEGLLASTRYADTALPDSLKIDTTDSVVTACIQHPVAFELPQEKYAPPPKPIPLTAKEQKNVRRQRRKEEHKEQQMNVRLGLEPAPPSKVGKSNYARVLGEEAASNPTAVEARVNRKIAERAQKHLDRNEERKLTK